METWAIILIVILALAIVAMVVVVYLEENKNIKANQKNILYPFTANVSDDGTVTLINSTNQPQIDCSLASGKNGGKINIVGSFTDVIDPYGECSPKSTSVIDLTCGIPGSKVPCKDAGDCGPGMKCEGSTCKPGTAKLLDKGLIDTHNSECGGNYCPVQPGTPCDPTKDGQCFQDAKDPIMNCVPTEKDSKKGTCEVVPGKSCMGVNTKHNTCAVFPLCSNVDFKNSSTVLNRTCAYNNKDTRCRPRDSSAYLANHCDGKTTCDAKFDLTSKDSKFGPLPCSINVKSQTYPKLPLIPGQGGNYIQGYYVHGLYTCIPDESS